jgi:hypothetical protein
MRRTFAAVPGVFVGACITIGAGSAIERFDETTIDPAALTARIEALTRAANVHGLTERFRPPARGHDRRYVHAAGVGELRTV